MENFLPGATLNSPICTIYRISNLRICRFVSSLGLGALDFKQWTIKRVLCTCHDRLFRVEDRVVRHCPLLGKGKTAQLGRLLEGLLELERHVLRAEIEEKDVQFAILFKSFQGLRTT